MNWKNYFQLKLCEFHTKAWMVLRLDGCIATNKLFESSDRAASWAKKETLKINKAFEKTLQ
jgi:hypothetical protein